MSDEQDDERTTIRVVFLGPDNTPGAYLWRYGDRTLAYKSLKARIPGGVYTIDARLDGDGVTVFGATLSYTGESAEDAAAIQLEARSAEARAAHKRLEANTSRTHAIDDTLGELLELAGKLKGYDQRAALASYVRDKIMHA